MSLAVSKRTRWRVFAQRKPLLTSDDQRSITRTTTRTRTIGRNWKLEGDGREITDKAKTEESCIPLDKEMSPRVVEMLTHLIDRFASIRMTSSFARIDRLIPPLFDSSSCSCSSSSSSSMSLAVSKRTRWRVFAQRKTLLTSDDQRSRTRTIGEGGCVGDRSNRGSIKYPTAT